MYSLYSQVRVPGSMYLAILLAQHLIHLILHDSRRAGRSLGRARGHALLHVQHVAMPAWVVVGRKHPPVNTWWGIKHTQPFHQLIRGMYQMTWTKQAT